MSEQARFVIQRHEREHEPTHWDLMIEASSVLETYRVAVGPEEWQNSPVEAVKIFDHPLKFLSYEGAVNRGKGRVTIADAGTYRVVTDGDNQRQLRFEGNILRGVFILNRVCNDKWELGPVAD